MTTLIPGASAELEVESTEVPCGTNSKGTVVTNGGPKDELSFGKAEKECFRDMKAEPWKKRLNRRASVVGCVPTVSQQFTIHIFSPLGFMEYQVRG
jgi:hypothetical protein